jgi:hypothetical protein
MKNLVKLILPAMPVLLLLALAGCSERPVNGFAYNPVGWEKRMKDPALGKEEFAQLYALAAAARFSGCKVFITGRLQVTLRPYEGAKIEVPLKALWAETVKDPANRSATCRRHLEQLKAANTPNKMLAARVDPDAILPVIWSGSPPENGKTVRTITTNGVETKFIRSTNQYVTEPFTADMYILYYCGEQGGVDTYLTAEDLSLLHLDLPALHRQAVGNLANRIPGVVHREPAPPYTVTAGGIFAASLLLIDRIWDKQASTVSGDLIAAVPSRNLLIFAGSAPAKDIATMRRMVQREYGSSINAISQTLLVRRNGRWEMFKDGTATDGKSSPDTNPSAPLHPK